MSKADSIFIKNCQDILDNGVWDTDRPVRPKWEDGTPAHTIKLFGVVNRYDLREEFPILTVRKQYLKSAIDELLWIWQRKSNLAEKVQQHSRPAQPRLGRLGGRDRLHREGLRLPAGGQV